MKSATSATGKPAGERTSTALPGSNPTRRAPRHQTSAEPALRLLPRRVREDVRVLYHVVRTLDDVVDEHKPDAAERVAAMEAWCGGEKPVTPETRMIDELERRYRFPREFIADFCKAMRHDIANTPIETDADLDLYCQRCAGTIGMTLAVMLGTSSPTVLAGMTTLGTAAQLTNILRDIDEDLAAGRVYIPREVVERFGSLAPGEREPLLRDQIARADTLYEASADAIRQLPSGRRAVACAAALYRQILREIERQGYGPEPQRVAVPSWRRFLIVQRHRLVPD